MGTDVEIGPQGTLYPDRVGVYDSPRQAIQPRHRLKD